MQTTFVSSVLVVLCAYMYDLVTADGQFNPKFANPLLQKRHDPAQLEMPEQEMCFTIPHLQALKEQFAAYIDQDMDGRASRDEIEAYLHKYNPDASDRQVDSFIARRDKDGNGYVDFLPDYLREISSPTYVGPDFASARNGYVDFIPDYLREISSPDYDLNTAKEWFGLEDTNGDGYVSRDELVKIAVKVGMPLDEAEKTANGYYMSADENGDGKLSWKEYTRLFLA